MGRCSVRAPIRYRRDGRVPPESVDDLDRAQWTGSVGVGGRFGSERVDDFRRNNQPEKVICRSLFSWVNAGSHNAHDDAYVTPSDAMIESQLRVFRAIFESTGHIAHYNMMMGEGLAEAPASV